jgi:hypothetical protein
MTDDQMEATLRDLLENVAYSDGDDRAVMGLDADDLEDARVETYEEAGVLTTNRGLVLRLRDGSEFQLTIVRSR